MPGILYIVSTPIGNLEDITLRALRILKSVAVIAAEDTRRTSVLLRHYDISTACLSHHKHNERNRGAQLIARLLGGEDVAVVTDAGTPSVSDPGFSLVRAAQQARVRVEVIPGPSAVLAALVLSGLPSDEFTFLGFAPARSKDKARWAAQVAAERRTVIFFDSPLRIRDTLTRLSGFDPNREVAIARELTKKFETVVKRPISEIGAVLADPPRGEITVVLGPSSVISQKSSGVTSPESAREVDDFCLMTEFKRLLTEPGETRRGAVKAVAKRFNLAPKAVYAAIERAKKTGSA